MFEPKNILFIPDYRFPNGNVNPKLLLILATYETNIVYTLTTSQDDYIPDDRKQKGCLNDKSSMLSMYMFIKDEIVGYKPDSSSFAFDKDTYVIFRANQLSCSTSELLESYPNIKHKGTFDNEEFDKLTNCLRNSEFLKSKFKKFF
ncbi:MAG: hypothetical protein EAZ97_12875 [Bacteroidetes bacterium]|nr:MAG: hypothetical protein EAZ97_12875 [Bacteroidota bacterium]